jgi:predicted TIM-barrel fold metal-dependent hydrolase
VEEWSVISVDDHVIEPPTTWSSRVPARYRDRCPRVVERGPDGFVWNFDGQARLFSGLMCMVDHAREDWHRPIESFADLYPGCSDPHMRLRDMDEAGVLASLCFPSMPGFGGTFLNNNSDRELSMACIRAYNDFMIEEWCGSAPGRFIPAVVVPYWDPSLAIVELSRCASRGARAVVFSERPHHQGFPSLFDRERYWDPLFAAAQEMALVLCCHIGSSSRVDMPDDADYLTHNCEIWLNAPYSMTEYIMSGTFDRFPELKVAYSEASIGWMPYMFQVMDHYYVEQGPWTKTEVKLTPSQYFGRNIFGCFINDACGSRSIERLGVDSVMVEVDYPHADTIWPTVRKVIDDQIRHLSQEDQFKVRRGNAERIFDFTPSALGHA